MTTNVSVSVIGNSAVTLTRDLSQQSDKPVRIQAIKGGKYVLAAGDHGYAPDNIVAKRAGKDLQVSFEGEDHDTPRLIIEDFFEHEGELVGLTQDATYHQYVVAGAEGGSEVVFLPEGVASPLALSNVSPAGIEPGSLNAPGDFFSTFAPWLGGLGGLLGLAAASGGGGGGGSNSNGAKPPVEPTPQPPVLPTTPGAVNISDASGSNNQPVLSGSGRPGDIVQILDNGVVIGEVVIGESGDWSFMPNPALGDGEHRLSVITKDPAGNASGESDPVVLVVDTIAPDAPTFNDLQGATNGNPVLGGTGTPGETVVIRDNGEAIGSVVVGEDGTWSFTPNPALGEGEHHLTVESVDKAGNVSEPSAPGVIVIDTTAPDAPTFNELPAATNENPALGGTGTPGETVVIRDNGREIGSVVVGEDGIWSFTPSPALGEGEHSLTVEISDAAGNVTTSDPQIIVIDTELPDAPAFNELPGATNENPTLSGAGTPGETIVIRDNGNPIGSVVVGEDGSWSFTPNPALGEGEHSLTVVAVDKAGNVSEPSAPGVIVIDTEVPDAPTLNELPGVSNENPTLSGSGTAGETIVIRDNGEEIGAVIVGEDGTWSFTPNPALGEGEHSLTVESVDAAGNVSEPSAPGLIVIGIAAPDAPTLNELPGATNENPTLSGSGTPGETIVIRDKGEEIGSVMVGEDGTWSFTPNPALGEGEHSLTVEAVNKAGNVSEPSAPNVIVIDTAAPDAPSLNELPNAASENPTLSGSGTPGDTVVIRDNGSEIGSVIIGEDGTWSFTPAPALGEGEHSLTVESVDMAGNVSELSDPQVIVIDTEAPAVPDAVNISDLSGGNNQPILSGHGQPGDTAQILDNGVVIGEAVVDESGKWSYVPEPALADGDHSLTVVIKDPAGNASAESDPVELVIDTVAPDAPVFNTLPGATNTIPTLSGTGTPGDTIVIRDRGTEIGTVVVLLDGTWSFTPELGEGEHSLTVEAVDAVGNVSELSDPQVVVIDTEAPAAPDAVNISDPSGSNNKPVLSGHGQPGDSVEILDNGVVIGEAVINESGEWAFTPEQALAEGPHSLSVIHKDPAGNASVESDPVELVIVPVPPTIDSFNDDVANVTGVMFSGSHTNDTTPTFSGTASANSTVVFKCNGEEVARFSADGEGKWSYTPSAMADGEYWFTVTSIDADSRELTSETFSLTVDTVPPPYAPTVLITDNVGEVTGTVLDGAIIDDNTPTFSGIAVPGTTIRIHDMHDFEVIGESKVNEDGTWSFTPSVPLADGNYNFLVYSMDEAGNSSAMTQTIWFTVQTPVARAFKVIEEEPNTPDDNWVITESDGGIDTLQLIGGEQLLDVSALVDLNRSIEVFDISGDGDNTLKLSLGDVLDHGAMDLFHASGDVQMMVKGDAGDVVILDDMLPNGITPGQWASGSAVEVEGVMYTSYQHSTMDAELLIQQGVQVNLV
jgi:signal peptidase I